MRKILGTLGVGIMVFSGAASGNIAYDNAANIGPLQNYGNSLGMDFTVNTSISVTALGVFNDGVLGNLDGVSGAGTAVEIVTPSGTIVVGPVSFSSTDAGTQVNGDAFKTISPVVLSPGNYTVTAFNTDNYNTNGAANSTSTLDASGLISYVGGGRYDNAGVNYPTHPDGGPPNRYDAGTFEFSAATPEPASLGLLGLAAVGMLARRRRA